MPFKTKPNLYDVWRSMRNRCLNPNAKQFADYGGRGITICARWDSYAAFEADMGERPPGYSLDRIDNEKGYSPENCRWADKKTQQRNQRRAVFVEVDGVRYRAIELAEAAGVKTDTIVSRAKRGLPMNQVMSPDKIENKKGLALGGKANGARQRARTHCKRGHAFTPENTLVTKEGWRACRRCHADRQNSRNARNRE